MRSNPLNKVPIPRNALTMITGPFTKRKSRDTMAEGDGGNAAQIATVDSSDVFNPKHACRNCGHQNDISVIICVSCGKDVYGTDKLTIDVDDTTMNGTHNKMKNGNNGKHKHNDSSTKKSLSNLFLNKKVLYLYFHSIVIDYIFGCIYISIQCIHNVHKPFIQRWLQRIL